MASSQAVPVKGSISIMNVLPTFKYFSQGQQCLFTIDQHLTYSGGLQGTSDTVGPVQWRFFAPCDEVLTSGFIGIPNIFSSVEHFVGVDGREATFVVRGKNDGFGDFDGTIALHGDLNGSLQTSEVAFGGVTYEGKVVFRD
jgi:hypothetical protein